MYNIGIYLLRVGLLLVSPFHKKARKMIEGRRETFKILQDKIRVNERYIWFHAASLGEFEQARSTIEIIKKEMPQYKILLTFFSPSGYDVQKEYPFADIVCYLPFDTSRNAQRFINIVRPHCAIFVKYEFWYNFIHTCHQQDVPVYLISAIFRDTQPFFKKRRGKYGNMLHLYSHIFVQDAASDELLHKFDISNVSVTGDTRMDRVIEIQEQSISLPVAEKFVKNLSSDTLIIVAGSSWPPDEEILIDYFNNRPNVKLIIAPHEIHESHLAEIEQKLKRPAIRYSVVTKENITEKACLILDCFGLLSSIYRYGHIAYIGGGFGAGIHNLPEAAVYGIPVVFGPNFHKFREAHDLIACGGGYAIQGKVDFYDMMDTLISSSAEREESGSKARKYIYKNAGATRRIMNKIFAAP